MNCSQPFTATNIFYASKWDTVMVGAAIAAIAENYTQYNDMAFCVEYDLYCEYLSYYGYSTADYDRAVTLSNNLTLIQDAWDGQGKF